MTENIKRRGAKPLHGETKQVWTFRATPFAISAIKDFAKEHQVSQSEVFERAMRFFAANPIILSNALDNHKPN